MLLINLFLNGKLEHWMSAMLSHLYNFFFQYSTLPIFHT